ncbi:hypothetical protein V5P93_003545 [Actinokineospora auranticolor]|uniref:Peptide zinc metalloprotease protein n=1 Tax=Actinokineospora auranticolor TaxID=155976 RepID=A0A2S6GPQ0_9PSEU|nr:hypothetical protein [Actinokineospora auranticolor]PPK67208.1 hypothetical protein CLV40_108206 [Actinokineospora auranticolor]
MTAPALDPDRPLALHPLTFHADGDEVTVGRADIGLFGVFPPDGAELLRKLAEGLTPNAAAAWYADEYGETVDIGEFLEILVEFEMLVGDGEVVAAAVPVRWRGLGRALFSPVALAVYAVVILGGLAVMIAVPGAAPHARNMFFTESLVVVQLALFFGQVPMLLAHESFHALAGRRLGINSSLSVGRRFYFLVFETKMDGLVAVPRKQRYLPILAGLLADGVVLGLCALLAAAVGVGHPIGRVALAFAFVTLLRVVWQFYFFLRTDLYYLVCTVLGCNDLQTVAGQLLRLKVDRLLRRAGTPVDESSWHPRDREVARWYVWLLVAGYAFLTLSALFALVPAVAYAVGIIAGRLGGDATVLGVLDAVVFLVLTIGPVIAAAVLARRSRRA